MDLLPDDILASILGCLPPCSLAASRCVRKKWCAIIDTLRLLRTDLLPLRLDGFFLVEDYFVHTYFYSRPSTGRRINGRNSFLMDYDYGEAEAMILDHCNGLLLLWELVANPATQQLLYFPPFPHPCFEGFYRIFFLAYDPFVSPQHFEVVLFPLVPEIGENIKFKEDSEWPPSTFTTHVFSSTKWRWEERSFVREGRAAGTIADMHSDLRARSRHAVYLHGALYVHCENDSVMRIALCNNKYQMIPSPAENQEPVTYLGKSEKGVYSAVLSRGNTWPRLRVWLLNESCGQMVWVLKSDTSLRAMVENFHIDYTGTPWIVNYRGEDVSEASAEDESEWNFDSGIVLHEPEDKVATYDDLFGENLRFLGFHPYKEIAFFFVSFRVVSYHLNSSKVQLLGSLRKPVYVSFPYTACWMGELLSGKS